MSYTNAYFYVGMILAMRGYSSDFDGWLLMDGRAISKTTYPILYSKCSASKGTCTISIATPAVVTNTGHGLLSGDKIFLTTTGALPTGLSINTTYWITKVDANTFKVSTSYANYVAGTFVNTTGTQSGTHTLTWTADGVQDANNFYLPDTRDKVIAGASATYGVGSFIGESTVTLTGRQSGIQNHLHTTWDDPLGRRLVDPNGGGSTVSGFSISVTPNTNKQMLTGSAGHTSALDAHNNMQPTTFENCFIYSGVKIS